MNSMTTAISEQTMILRNLFRSSNSHSVPETLLINGITDLIVNQNNSIENPSNSNLSNNSETNLNNNLESNLFNNSNANLNLINNLDSKSWQKI